MNSKPKIFKLAEIREAWFAFFEEHKHLKVDSASLIPSGDPTLLFTTAGMVQFKNYFAGTVKPPASKVVSLQKCLRTTDLEEVGKTDRHCTFFEMLGNFSFGDYFKKSAIELSWKFSLEVLGLDPKQIHITVYEKDDESVDIWHKTVGVPLDKITRLDKKDNFWGPAGDSGACGPCSELYLDRGIEKCSCVDKQACTPGDECDRYMEYWNLVFNQYNQDVSGKQTPLPQTGIDTGAGLERLATLLGDLDSVYDTDELARIIVRITELTGELREDKISVIYDIKQNPAPFRVIADHVRAASFAIADGIYPDNTGRGYVIRRLVRRALLYARELGVFETILHKLVPLVVEIYGTYYPELKRHEEEIKQRIQIEEDRFLRTLEQGLGHWQDYLDEHQKNKATIFDGESAFILYDTYGFPLEMTRELAEKSSLTIDQAGFDKAMAEQKERSRSGTNWKDVALPSELSLPIDFDTSFNGFDQNECCAKIMALIDQEDKLVETLQVGMSGIVILDETVCYAEGGGQQGDKGLIQFDDNIFEISDTRHLSGKVVHIGLMKSGEIKTGQKINITNNESRRLQLTRHHSATHLLNGALRKHLGDHITQTGSLVAVEYLRFDFSHPKRIEPEILLAIEADVLEAIEQAESVNAEVMPIKEAGKLGAVATFGEKYGEEVRVVSMGANGTLSQEFCGGCHVTNTSEIDFFHIIKESSPGAGNRRIEALAGHAVVTHFASVLEQILIDFDSYQAKTLELTTNDSDAQAQFKLTLELPKDSAAQFLKKPSDVIKLHQKLELAEQQLAKANKALNKYKKKLAKTKTGSLLDGIDDLITQAQSIGGNKVLSFDAGDIEPNALRQLADKIREKLRGVVVLVASSGEKPMLLFAADKIAVESGVNCGSLIKATAPIINGGGGGRPDMAQAGGKDATKVGEALNKALELIKGL